MEMVEVVWTLSRARCQARAWILWGRMCFGSVDSVLAGYRAAEIVVAVKFEYLIVVVVKVKRG